MERQVYRELLDFLSRKGGYELLRAVEEGTKRWKDIEKTVLVSPRTLSRRISEALELGLIERVKQLRGGMAYRLTEKGRNVLMSISEKTPEGYITEPPPEKEKAKLIIDEDPVLMYFPRCPVCHGPQSKLRQIKRSRKDYLLCFSCGAKWHLKLKSDGTLIEAKLVAEGADGQGANLLGKSHEPDYWLRKALKGRTPWPKEESMYANEE